MKILEGKQLGYVYHFTYSDNALEIIKANLLKRSQDVEYRFGRPLYFVSLTRNKRLEADAGFGWTVRFTIDGDRLTDKYSVYPFNFYSGSARYGVYSPKDSESEERVWFQPSDKGISEFLKYVKSVDILENSDNISDIVKALKDSKSFNGVVNIVKTWR